MKPFYLKLKIGNLKFAFAVCAFFLYAANAHAGLIIQRPVALGLERGLVGYWSFDGQDMGTTSALDRSGNGNTGWAVDGPQKVLGKIGQALSFDGSNKYLKTTFSTYTSQMTYTAWFKANDLVGSRAIFATDDSSNGIMLRIDNDFYLRFWSNVCCAQATQLTTVSPGQWYHVGVMFDQTADIVKFYLDGALIGTEPLVTDYNGSPGNIQIARRGSLVSDGETFYGAIDDVRIYNRALMGDEVKRLYKIGSTFTINKTRTDTLRDGLVAHWTFDGPNTNVAANGRMGASDVAGGNYTARTTTAARTPKTVIGKIGQAVDFDGGDDMLANAASLGQTSAHSISAWIYPRKYGNDASHYGAIVERVSGAIEWGFALDNITTSNGLTYLINCTSALQVFAANSVTLNKWQHVVVTWSGGCANTSVTFYVDGVVKTRSGASGTGSPPNDNGLAFEISSDNSDQYRFNGILDDLRVYNRALTGDEVKRLYKLGVTATVNSTRKDTLRDGLVGHWTMDGDDTALSSNGVLSITDRSISNKRGLLQNGAPGFVIGKIGQAVELGGGNDEIWLGTSGYTGIGPLSISAWVYSRQGNDGVIMSNASDSCRQGGTREGFNFQNGNFTGTRRICFEADHVSASLILETNNNAFEFEKWHHAVVTWDGTTAAAGAHIYVDAVEATYAFSADGSGAISAVADNLYIGNTNSVSHGWNGFLDDVRIYNRVLTADEIKRLYLMGR